MGLRDGGYSYGPYSYGLVYGDYDTADIVNVSMYDIVLRYRCYTTRYYMVIYTTDIDPLATHGYYKMPAGASWPSQSR